MNEAKKPKNGALIRAGLVDKAIKDVKEESPATSIGNNSAALPPLVKQVIMTDRRYRKDKPPVLKKFKTYIKQKE
jgi:hypothetical protein